MGVLKYMALLALAACSGEEPISEATPPGEVPPAAQPGAPQQVLHSLSAIQTQQLAKALDNKNVSDLSKELARQLANLGIPGQTPRLAEILDSALEIDCREICKVRAK